MYTCIHILNIKFPIHNIMKRNKEIIAITLDPITKEKADSYGEAHGLSRSAVIRLCVNDFFIREAKHGYE